LRDSPKGKGEGEGGRQARQAAKRYVKRSSFLVSPPDCGETLSFFPLTVHSFFPDKSFCNTFLFDVPQPSLIEWSGEHRAWSVELRVKE